MKWVALACCLVLAGCGCGGNDDAVAMAKALPQSRLERLARDVSALAAGDGRKRWSEDGGIPAQFRDLHPREVNADNGIVYLSGCVDDKVLLIVHRAGDGQASVVLSPGEGGVEETLWRGAVSP